MKNRLPRVLIISHNALRIDTNNGKTLNALFQNWDKEKIAQLYFHPELPKSPLCENYYQITEVDIIKNIINKERCGRIVNVTLDKPSKDNNLRENFIKVKNFYIMYFLRDMLWSTNKWQTEELREWINNFRPEILFLIMPGVKFSAKIANWIADTYSIPVLLFITDDYYRNYRRTLSPVYHLFQFTLRNTINKILEHTKHLITVSRKTSEIYSQMFSLPASEIYTPSRKYFNEDSDIDRNEQDIVYFRYFGNLDLNRWKTLKILGESIDFINRDGIRAILEIYSGTTDGKIINNLTFGTGCRFMGWITGNEYVQKLIEADVVVHAESFNKNDIRRVELSLSTKIADYLGAGKCILAIAPKYIASMIHLQQIAVQVTNKEGIFEAVMSLINDSSLRYKHQRLSAEAATLLHNEALNCKKLEEIIKSIYMQEMDNEI